MTKYVEIERLAPRHHKLTFMPIPSDVSLGARWPTSFVADATAKNLQDFEGWGAYTAGPPPMVEKTMRIVTERGFGPKICMPLCFLRSEKYQRRWPRKPV